MHTGVSVIVVSPTKQQSRRSPECKGGDTLIRPLCVRVPELGHGGQVVGEEFGSLGPPRSRRNKLRDIYPDITGMVVD